MSNQEHSTTQAHEQPQTPGTPPDEHPADLRSRPNDAHNEHKASDTGLDDVQYPPQLHAGKVGIGPHYHEHDHVTIGNVIKGEKEKIKGTIFRNQEVKQKGEERVTGELLKKEKEKDQTNPFGKKDEASEPAK